jgi:hypothetical protein
MWGVLREIGLVPKATANLRASRTNSQVLAGAPESYSFLSIISDKLNTRHLLAAMYVLAIGSDHLH